MIGAISDRGSVIFSETFGRHNPVQVIMSCIHFSTDNHVGEPGRHLLNGKQLLIAVLQSLILIDIDNHTDGFLEWSTTTGASLAFSWDKRKLRCASVEVISIMMLPGFRYRLVLNIGRFRFGCCPRHLPIYPLWILESRLRGRIGQRDVLSRRYYVNSPCARLSAA
jgi:hypothetical protein